MKVCEWRENENGQWETFCGHCFETVAGTPATNGMRFCPYCGETLKETPYKEKNRMIQTGNIIQLTGKCFNCGKPVILGLDGIYEDKECCYDCFLKYFRGVALEVKP